MNLDALLPFRLLFLIYNQTALFEKKLRKRMSQATIRSSKYDDDNDDNQLQLRCTSFYLSLLTLLPAEEMEQVKSSVSLSAI